MKLWRSDWITKHLPMERFAESKVTVCYIPHKEENAINMLVA
jgi:hypothetical protein